MQADVVFKHEQDPCVVLRVARDDYFVVTSNYYVDMTYQDDISGDLSLEGIKWVLNLTRSSLVDVKVMGRYATMRAAIQATSISTVKH